MKLDIGCFVQVLTPLRQAIGTSKFLIDSNLDLEGLDTKGSLLDNSSEELVKFSFVLGIHGVAAKLNLLFFEDVSSLNRHEAHVLFYLFFLSSSLFHAYVTTLKDWFH